MSTSSITTKGPPVVIVAYKNGPILEECLSALLSQSLPPKEILVIDNGSSEKTLNKLNEFFHAGKIHLIRPEINLGFAAANNLAFDRYKTEHSIALLNPDAIPEPTWLEQLCLSLELSPNIASVSSVMTLHSHSSIIDGMGDAYHFTGLAWRRGHQRPLHDQHLYSSPPFSCCGAACLFRTEALIEIGGFDADFFCYMEDVDLGFRLLLSGRETVISTEAIVRHIGGESSGRNRDFMVYQGHRNLEWVFFKNMPLPLLVLFFPFHVVMVFLLFILLTFRGQGRAYLRAKRDALTGLGKVLRKRSSTQNQRKISIFSLAKKMDFLVSFHRIFRKQI